MAASDTAIELRGELLYDGQVVDSTATSLRNNSHWDRWMLAPREGWLNLDGLIRDWSQVDATEISRYSIRISGTRVPDRPPQSVATDGQSVLNDTRGRIEKERNGKYGGDPLTDWDRSQYWNGAFTIPLADLLAE